MLLFGMGKGLGSVVLWMIVFLVPDCARLCPIVSRCVPPDKSGG